MRIVIQLSCICLLLLPSGAPTQERQTNLEKVAQKIEETDAQFRELVSKLEATQALKIEQEQDLKQARAKEASSKKEFAQIQVELTKLRAQLVESEKRISRLNSLWRQRVRAVYMYRERSVLGSLISVSTQSLDRKALYISRLRDFDQKLADQMEKQLVLQQARKNELQQKLVQEQKLAALLALERGKVEKSVALSAKLTTDLGAQKASLSKSLVELKAQALRLETVVTSLTGGDEQQRSRTTSAPKVEEVQKRELFEGKGLFSLKGSLSLPLKGEVLRGFGKRGVRRLDDIVASKGVEYRAEAGADASAIAPAMVIHVGKMPGYGNIVILDHGKRYYTLYGRLEKIEVKKGEQLVQGAKIGTLGASADDKSSNFYFEIRRNGEAVNPLDYFKKL